MTPTSTLEAGLADVPSRDTSGREIHRHEGRILRRDRERAHGHLGATVWLTGLSGAGKSTLAYALDEALFRRGVRSYVLDGDNLRHGLNRDLGFAPSDRSENIRRVAEVAHLFADSGTVVIAAFISPYRSDREAARAIHAPGSFYEVHVKCPLQACEERDPKGLYRRARSGLIPRFTGVSAPYEAPEDPELVVPTDRLSVDEGVALVHRYLEAQGILRGPQPPELTRAEVAGVLVDARIAGSTGGDGRAARSVPPSASGAGP